MAFKTIQKKFILTQSHIDAYINGLTLTEVGELAGVRCTTIRNALKQLGILRTAAESNAIARSKGRLAWQK